MRQPPPLASAAIVLALACLAVIGYKLAPQRLAADERTLVEAPACDLNERACAADLPGVGRVELAITPRPIAVVKPLRIVARFDAAVADDVRKVEIDFAGASMDMGYNRQTLAADGAHDYRGVAMLPVCVSGRMRWQATLLVTTDARRYAAAFVFEAPVAAR